VNNLNLFFQLDFIPLATALLVATSCALLGNFLVLRKLSMMGDAISHVVLPGIVVSAYLASKFNHTEIFNVYLFVGAAASGVLSTLLIQLIVTYARIETGAAMGVVFSTMFALGVLLIENLDVSNIDLDPDCLLYGQLESLVWFFESTSLSDLYVALPSGFLITATTFILSFSFVVLFYKELKITAFDSALATALGFRSNILHQTFMVVTALVVVSSFQAVGSILVIGMLICPAAAARLITESLITQIVASILISLIAALCGYFFASYIPWVFGFDFSLNTAGMIVVCLGIIFAISYIFSPTHGVFVEFFHKKRIMIRMNLEDVLGYAYRRYELEDYDPENSLAESFTHQEVIKYLPYLDPVRLQKCLALGVSQKWLKVSGSTFSLTKEGLDRGSKLVRSHRLWEHYLHDKAALDPERLHAQAHNLEHYTDSSMRLELSREQNHPDFDPHGSKIPRES
jgi:manganese/zinc/iron transport system permease protein